MYAVWYAIKGCRRQTTHTVNVLSEMHTPNPTIAELARRPALEDYDMCRGPGRTSRREAMYNIPLTDTTGAEAAHLDHTNHRLSWRTRY
jgi:hypothetical protein